MKKAWVKFSNSSGNLSPKTLKFKETFNKYPLYVIRLSREDHALLNNLNLLFWQIAEISSMILEIPFLIYEF